MNAADDVMEKFEKLRPRQRELPEFKSKEGIQSLPRVAVGNSAEGRGGQEPEVKWCGRSCLSACCQRVRTQRPFHHRVRNNPPPIVNAAHSTVTLFARFLGLSTSVPRATAV
jgi:hypothetical protein